MSTPTNKKTFTILCAYDVPCYATIEVEAETEEEAAKMIEGDFWGVTGAEEFEPDWSQPDNPRAYLGRVSGGSASYTLTKSILE